MLFCQHFRKTPREIWEMFDIVKNLNIVENVDIVLDEVCIIEPKIFLILLKMMILLTLLKTCSLPHYLLRHRGR